MITSSPSKRHERRSYRRYQTQGGDLQISWVDVTGAMKVTRARAIDVSENGISLRLPEPVQIGRVRFQSARSNVRGIGDVRQCHRDGTKYVVGLEFAGGLHWRAPDGEVQDPIPLCFPGS